MNYTMSRIIILLILTSTFCTFAQRTAISGYIIDGETGERLIGATIVDSETKNGTTTNNYGFYSLHVSTLNNTTLKISFIGYDAVNEEVLIKESIQLNIALYASSYELDEVEVVSSKDLPIEKRNEIGVLSISTKQIKTMPALGGEVDVLKAFQFMPGVQSGNEGTSGLYVRGGSPDQNLVLLDDVPLYYVNHLGGFISSFNINAIQNVKLIKGGFPARHGGRLSSILDIRMKDGNMKKFEGSGMLGMLSGKLTLQGPIKKDTSSFIISGRRMLYDLITRPVARLAIGTDIGYTFYDFNAKYNRIYSVKDRLFFSGYFGRDKAIISKKGDQSFKNLLRWGNQMAAMRWNHVYSQKLFGNITTSFTRYDFFTENSSKFNRAGQTLESIQEFSSSIFDFGIKTDFEYSMSSNYKVKFGTNSIYHTFKPGITSVLQKSDGQPIIDDVTGNNKRFAWENSAYIENEISLFKKINFNLGLRAANYHINGKDYFSLEPRLLANFLLPANVALRGAFSKMNQNVHLLTTSGVGLPRDLWVPATERVAPQNAEQWSFAIAKSIYNNTYELSIEGYHKKLNNLIEYKDGASFLTESADWEDLVVTDGKGKSYGVELLVQKKLGKTSGWVGYTWSKTNRQFDNLNDGKEFPYRYDRRNDASIVLSHKYNKKIDFSANWVYSTGISYTLPNGRYDIYNEFDDVNGGPEDELSEVLIYGERNANKLRPYHRLDVGVNFRKKKKWGERTLNLSVYNLYARRNAYYYYIGANQNGDGNRLYQQSLFSFIPSISYGFTF